MKHKYFVMTLCASALLTACSSGGGSNNQPSQPPKDQGQSQNAPAPKAPDNSGQQQNNPAPNVPDNSGQQQNNPAPNVPDNSGQQQNNPAPNVPDNSRQQQNNPAPNVPNNSGQQQNNPAPNVPDNSGQQQNSPAPNVPDNSGQMPKDPEVTPPQPTPSPKYTGEYASKYTSSGTWNGGKDEIIVYEITPTKEFEEGISGAKPYTSKEVRLTLAEAQADGKNYKFLPLDEVGYYGYRQALEPDGKERYNDYVYAVNEKLVAKEVPTGLNATYHRENGFIFGPANTPSNSINATSNISDVNIVFHNGEATGSVTKEGKTPFLIKGDTKSLIFESNDVNFISWGTKTAMEPKFVHSSEGANDFRYITGVVKGEDWAGVLAAEKK